MELFSLLAIILGVLGGFKLMGWAMVMLADKFNIDQKVLPYIAFTVVFVGIVLIVRLLAKTLRMSIDKTFLGQADQIAGAVLGGLKTVFLMSIVMWIFESLRMSFVENWSEKSWLYPKVSAVAPMVTQWIGKVIPVFKDIF